MRRVSTRRVNVAGAALAALTLIPCPPAAAGAPPVAVPHWAKEEVPAGITFLDPDSAEIVATVALPRSPDPIGFNRDGSVLYAFGSDRRGLLGVPGRKAWDLLAISLHTLEGRSLGVVGKAPFSYSFDPGRGRLYVAGTSKKANPNPIRVFDIARERDLGVLASVERLRSLVLSPDGTLVYALCAGKKHKKPKGAPGNLHVLDAGTGAELARYDAGKGASSVVFDPGRGLAYVLGARDEEGRGRVAVLHRSDRVAEIPLPGPGVAVVPGPDGTAYALAPGTVARLSPDGRSVASAWTLGIHPASLLFDAARGRAFAGEGAGSGIAELDLVGGTVVAEHSTGSPGKKAGKGFGMALATIVAIAAAAGGAPVAGIPGGHAPTSLALAPDGSALYVLNGFTNDISVFDTTNHDVVEYIPTGGGSRRILRAPDDPNLWVESQRRLVRVNTESLQVDREIDLAKGMRRAAVAYDPVRGWAWIVSGTSLSVLDLRSGEAGKTVELPFPGSGVWIPPPSSPR